MIIATMLCLRIMVRKNLIPQEQVNVLVKKEPPTDPPHLPESLKFLSESVFHAAKAIEKVPCFENLCHMMEGESNNWRKWYADQEPELSDLPKSVKDISLFERIILLRALRPDRTINALK